MGFGGSALSCDLCCGPVRHPPRTGSCFGAGMTAWKIGDLVLPLDDNRPWRIVDLYQAPATGREKALIEFLGDAWRRFRTVLTADLRPAP